MTEDNKNTQPTEVTVIDDAKVEIMDMKDFRVLENPGVSTNVRVTKRDLELAKETAHMLLNKAYSVGINRGFVYGSTSTALVFTAVAAVLRYHA